jgi:monoamine oxidase
MSRSAKFPLLRSLLEAATEAQLTDQQIEQRVSRRSFLKSSAIVGGISTIDWILPPISYSQRKTTPKIVIVGAGLAGLTAAYELRKRGINATIFEANNRVGGRVLSARDVIAPGLVTEYGGEFIDSGHSNMRRMAREFRLTLQDVKSPKKKNQKELYYFDGKHYTHQDVVNAFKPISTRLAEDAKKISGPYDRTFARYDMYTLEQYLWSLSCDEWLRKLLTVAYVTEYGADARMQSAVNMLSMIDTDILDGRLGIFGDSDERYRIKGGNDLLPKAIAKKLTNNIELGHYLVSLKKSPGEQYVLEFGVGAESTKTVKADIVIMTIPFSVLRCVETNAFSTEKWDIIRALGYGNNSKIIFGVMKERTKTPWELTGHSGAMYSDLRAQSGWESAPDQSRTDTSYTVYLGGKRADLKQVLAEDVRYDMNTIVPGLEKEYNGTSKTFGWQDYKYSYGSYSVYAAGEWSFQGLEGKPEGDVYFAGEHCSKNYQGFMEGAAETGVAAAKQVLSKVNK